MGGLGMGSRCSEVAPVVWLAGRAAGTLLARSMLGQKRLFGSFTFFIFNRNFSSLANR